MFEALRKLKRKIEYSNLYKTWKYSPCVSIIIPVYNAEAYLPQMLDSLIKQKFKEEDFEIIAVDDGSTDKSLEILKKYALKSKSLRVYTQKNQYAGVARNLGMKYARGEYLLFLDSDDFFEPNLVEETYKAAKQYSADVVMFGANLYNDQTKVTRNGRHLLDMRVVPEKQPFNCKDCPDQIFQISTACPWTKLFRREFIKETGLQFQNLHNANDVFFVYSALAMAKSIVTVDKVLVTYREGLKNNLQSSKKRYFVEAYTAWHDKLEEIGLLEDLKRSYVNRTLKSCLYNLRAAKDLEMKRQIFDRLHQEVFDRLEILEYDESYYYHRTNYRELLAIREGNFEKCMELQEKQNL